MTSQLNFTKNYVKMTVKHIKGYLRLAATICVWFQGYDKKSCLFIMNINR